MRTHPHRSVIRLCVACIGLGTMGPSLCGCDSASKAMANRTDSPRLFGRWTLSNLGGKDIASRLPGGARPPTLSVAEDGTVSGFSGVNRFSSSLDPAKIASGEFSLANIASTLMAGPPESMKLESEFLNSLQQVTGFNLDGDSLALTRGADTLMTFVRSGA